MKANNNIIPENFRYPAIWEPHEGTWLAWPHNKYTPGYQLKLEKLWLDMTGALMPNENVHIIAYDEQHQNHIEQQIKYFFGEIKNIYFHIIQTSDMWICDIGAVFVVDKNGNEAVVDWNFNGWGNRYDYDKDAKVASIIAKEYSLPIFNPPLVQEGGHEVNGAGDLLVTKTSILNSNRNPGMTESEATKILCKYLGLKNVIWLSGMDGSDKELGEETDCHIDLLCRFVNENTVLYGWPDSQNEKDPLFQRLLKPTLNELREAVTASGKSLNLIPVPVPASNIFSTTQTGTVEVIKEKGRARLGTGQGAIGNCCGYLDWHVANNIVLVPVFGDENDDRAISIIREHFPKREIIPLDGRLLLEGGGGIHCATKERYSLP